MWRLKNDTSPTPTHVPALSTPPFSVCHMVQKIHAYLHPRHDRNQIFLVRHRRGACQMLSAGLCRIVTQQSSRDIAQITYVDISCVYPCWFLSMSLLNGNLLRS